MARILIVEDDHNLADAVAVLLRASGHEAAGRGTARRMEGTQRSEPSRERTEKRLFCDLRESWRR